MMNHRQGEVACRCGGRYGVLLMGAGTPIAARPVNLRPISSTPVYRAGPQEQAPATGPVRWRFGGPPHGTANVFLRSRSEGSNEQHFRQLTTHTGAYINQKFNTLVVQRHFLVGQTLSLVTHTPILVWGHFFCGWFVVKTVVFPADVWGVYDAPEREVGKDLGHVRK